MGRFMPSTSFIAPLHGLRGIAALLVVVGHATPVTGFPSVVPIDPSLGVMLFFVLSGYLMGALYLPLRFNGPRVWSYAVARFARIYPLFALVIVASVALPIYGATWFRFDWSAVPAHLLLVGDGLTVWTIAVECQFYAIFVAIWWAHSRMSTERDTALLIAAALAIGLLMLWGLDGERNALNRYLHLFFMGLAASALVRQIGDSKRFRRIAGYALPLMLAAFVLSYIMRPGGQAFAEIYADLTVSLIAMLLVLCAVLAPASWTGRLLGSAPLVWLGEISLGLYLLHRPVLLAFEHSHIAEGLPPALQTLVIVLVAAIVAWPVHLLIERPARHAIRQLADRPAPAVAA
jgi:peptidoglycan/LPS O-acetylase OafA/YrhL